MTIFDVLLQIWWFVLGAVLGSFLNVVIYRLPRKESLIWPGSHCPQCGHPIRWHDNLPILSWFLLRGRCRDCSAPISIRYPIIEALAALTVGLAAYAISGGRWGSVLAGGKEAWYLPFSASAILQVVMYSTFFLSLMATAAMAWDRQVPPRFFWLPAWGIVLLGVLVTQEGNIGAGSHRLSMPSPSWFHWGLALVLGSLCELLMSGWEAGSVQKESTAKRRRRKDRRAKRNQTEEHALPSETATSDRTARTVDFVSLAGLGALLFKSETALVLVGTVLFLAVFMRAGSLLSRKSNAQSGDSFRVRAVLLGIGFIASWIAVLLEVAG